jgi:hypothetical protein
MVAKRLKPFIDNDLDLVGYRRIPYLSLSGGGRDGVGFGTKAELIPNICDVWLKAREAGLLNQRQRAIAEKAEIMLRGLANVGITALVDEATGYQYIRDRDELQKILSAYISPTLLPWTKRFPDEFFQEMFRVYGWQWPPEEGSYGGPKGPRYAGKLIKQIIYGNLPPGVLDELERQNPADSKWQRRTRMTQLLTDTIGHPHVEKLVAVITALFRIADSRQQFWRLYQKAFPKRGDQLEAEV